MFKLRRIQSRILQTFHTFPFYLNSKEKLFTSDSKTYQTHFCRSFFIFPFLILFQLIQLTRLIYSGEFNKITFLYVDLLLNVVVVVNSYIVTWRQHEYLGFINGNIKLGNRIASKLNIFVFQLYLLYHRIIFYRFKSPI